MTMEVSDVRRRLVAAIERARQAAADRRAEVAAARDQYDRFLGEIAIPVFQMFAMALRAEGLPFTVLTPAGSVRLTAEKSSEHFIELGLDTSGERPVVLGRSNRARGRRIVTSERPIRDGAPIAALRDEDVLEFLLTEIEPFVVR